VVLVSPLHGTADFKMLLLVSQVFAICVSVALRHLIDVPLGCVNRLRGGCFHFPSHSTRMTHFLSTAGRGDPCTLLRCTGDSCPVVRSAIDLLQNLEPALPKAKLSLWIV